MAEITSDELNFLVFRYLQESGFTHTAFVLNYEAGIDKIPVDGHTVPPGSLVKVIQKGLQYVEMEANLSNNDVDIDGDDYIIAKPWDLLTKDVNELQNIIEEKRGNLKKLVVDKASKRQQAEHAELEDMKGCGKGTSADTEVSCTKRPKSLALGR